MIEVRTYDIIKWCVLKILTQEPCIIANDPINIQCTLSVWCVGGFSCETHDNIWPVQCILSVVNCKFLLCYVVPFSALQIPEFHPNYA